MKTPLAAPFDLTLIAHLILTQRGTSKIAVTHHTARLSRRSLREAGGWWLVKAVGRRKRRWITKAMQSESFRSISWRASKASISPSHGCILSESSYLCPGNMQWPGTCLFPDTGAHAGATSDRRYSRQLKETPSVPPPAAPRLWPPPARLPTSAWRRSVSTPVVDLTTLPLCN